MSTAPDNLRAEIITACRVLTYYKLVEGFGHVSARIPGSDHLLITPRRALGLVAPAELVEVDLEGRQVGGEGRPPLETPMHLAVYRRRPDVAALCRAHPRFIAAYACAAEPLQVAHGFGTNLGTVVPVFRQPFLIVDAELGEGVAEALGQGEAVILQSNGMLATGTSVPEACVKTLFLEEMARAQLTARAAGLAPRAYTPEAAVRRRGMDTPNEPVRAWEFYAAAAEGRL
ncbi:MAG: class II aldolase/adducin family protein [Chloroflexi bacterium]|nr:class II aldolase/adducin family protein [Chloroflexota bacterium]